MSDREPDDNNELENGLAELREHRVEPHPDLEGRVKRDINRRTLAADSLDFSLNVMVATFWEHLRAAIESWPGNGHAADGKED